MKSSNIGLQIPKKMRMGGMTLYVRRGQVVARPARQHEKRSNTLKQFKQRQKMRHTMALWKMLSFCEVFFTERQNAYLNFASLANRLPVVYVTNDTMRQASFLMPDIPVSDGTLPTINQHLGEVDGVPALITDCKLGSPVDVARLLLYTAEQTIENEMPRVRFDVREISCWDMPLVDGCLAIKSEEFADDMKGWALVDVYGDRCSPQRIVTRCTLYQQYTTEDALKKAADSYGGITNRPFLSPE